MKQVNLSIQTTREFFSFSVTESRAKIVIDAFTEGQWVSIEDKDYTGFITKHTFNPRHVVSVSVSPAN